MNIYLVAADEVHYAVNIVCEHFFSDRWWSALCIECWRTFLWWLLMKCIMKWMLLTNIYPHEMLSSLPQTESYTLYSTSVSRHVPSSSDPLPAYSRITIFHSGWKWIRSWLIPHDEIAHNVSRHVPSIRSCFLRLIHVVISVGMRKDSLRSRRPNIARK